MDVHYDKDLQPAVRSVVPSDFEDGRAVLFDVPALNRRFSDWYWESRSTSAQQHQASPELHILRAMSMLFRSQRWAHDLPKAGWVEASVVSLIRLWLAANLSDGEANGPALALLPLFSSFTTLLFALFCSPTRTSPAIDRVVLILCLPFAGHCRNTPNFACRGALTTLRLSLTPRTSLQPHPAHLIAVLGLRARQTSITRPSTLTSSSDVKEASHGSALRRLCLGGEAVWANARPQRKEELDATTQGTTPSSRRYSGDTITIYRRASDCPA